MTLTERIARLIPTVRATGQAPLLGISIEGTRPFVCDRYRFHVVTNHSMELVSAELVEVERARGLGIEALPSRLASCSGERVRALEIVGSRGRVKSRTLLYDLDPAPDAKGNPYIQATLDMRKVLEDWAKSLAESRRKPKLTKYGRAIAKLERELAREVHIPLHPLVPQFRWGVPCYYSHYEWSAWRADKPKRQAWGRDYRKDFPALNHPDAPRGHKPWNHAPCDSLKASQEHAAQRPYYREAMKKRNATLGQIATLRELEAQP